MADVAVGIKLNALDGYVEAAFATQVGEELAVAEAAHGGGVLGNARVQQRLDFRDESTSDLISDTVVNRPVEANARHRESDLQRVERRGSLAFLRGHWNAGLLVDLQGADNTA